MSPLRAGRGNFEVSSLPKALILKLEPHLTDWLSTRFMVPGPSLSLGFLPRFLSLVFLILKPFFSPANSVTVTALALGVSGAVAVLKWKSKRELHSQACPVLEKTKINNSNLVAKPPTFTQALPISLQWYGLLDFSWACSPAFIYQCYFPGVTGNLQLIYECSYGQIRETANLEAGRNQVLGGTGDSGPPCKLIYLILILGLKLMLSLILLGDAVSRNHQGLFTVN